MMTDIERFNEIAEKVMSGEMSQQAGANELGIPVSTLRYRMDMAFPDRPRGVNVRIRAQRTGNPGGRPKGSTKFETILETLFTDDQMCDMLIKAGRCSQCPLMDQRKGCPGCKGLVYAMLRKVPKRHVENLSMDEFDKAVKILTDKGISLSVYRHLDGWVCDVYTSNGELRACDFILNGISYGHEAGLLEWWCGGNSKPKGNLTAEQCVELCLDYLS